MATLTACATFLLRARPDDPRIGDLLTKVLAVEPEAVEMLETCRLANGADPASLGKRIWYACALLWHGDLGRGLEFLSSLLYHPDLPDMPELQAEVWFCALVYLPEREEEACESLRRAINCGAVIRHQRLQAHLRHLEVPAPRVQYLEGVEKVLMSSASSEVRLNDPIWSRRPEKSSEAAALS